MNHVESLQVSQGFADLEAVQEQRCRGHDVLLLHQVAPQLSGEVWKGAAKPALWSVLQERSSKEQSSSLSCNDKCFSDKLAHLSVLVELHDYPDGVYLNDPD